MSDLALEPSRAPLRLSRLIAFRTVAAVLAVLLLVGFGVWQSVLTPWVTFPDTGDHGWARTPELHRLADSVSAGVLGSMGAAAILLAVRPRRSWSLTAWLVTMLVAVGVSSVVGSAIQGHDLMGAVVFLVAWTALLVAPLALLSPDRRAAVGGEAVEEPPGPGPVTALRVLVVIGVLLSLGAVWWRLRGGVVEDPREDDVVGLVLLGVSVTSGAVLCLRGRAGWRRLAVLLAGLTAYVLLAVISIALR